VIFRHELRIEREEVGEEEEELFSVWLPAVSPCFQDARYQITTTVRAVPFKYRAALVVLTHPYCARFDTHTHTCCRTHPAIP